MLKTIENKVFVSKLSKVMAGRQYTIEGWIHDKAHSSMDISQIQGLSLEAQRSSSAMQIPTHVKAWKAVT